MEKSKEDVPGQNKEFIIIVNAKEKIFTEKKISFKQVVELEYGTMKEDGRTAYTVQYSKGEDKKPKGNMVKGDEVPVKNGMVFYVSKSDKS